MERSPSLRVGCGKARTQPQSRLSVWFPDHQASKLPAQNYRQPYNLGPALATYLTLRAVSYPQGAILGPQDPSNQAHIYRTPTMGRALCYALTMPSTPAFPPRTRRGDGRGQMTSEPVTEIIADYNEH